ncbi:hypothetical protein GO988_23560 [Hymenobacter sp. HMF4947]|uniref:Uncharacterized protein n=1 Tax=Hymenobacter ginkgonis TaxID=2682976 RepID=A0A7K1TMH3_9BACT|nr:hypothetical protein [Hymenobacter ginkgonis]MVN79321.1 hypothetical protein [Hymenobacter ginkgonis]
MAHELDGIINWLAAGDVADYREGVLLLQDHSGNRGMVNNLLKKESDNNRAKLRYELVKVLCGGRLEEVAEVINHFAQAVEGAVTPVQQIADVLVEAHRPQLTEGFAAQPAPEHVPEAMQPQLGDLTERMSKLYNQRCQLSNTLADLSDEEGPRVVAEILDLQNQYNVLAEQRRRLAAGDPVNEQPAPAPAGEQSAAPLDRAALVQQRNTLRSRLSKARKGATEAKTEAKRSEHAQKAGMLEVELSTVEMQLAQPQ